jgi:hypothetical protein
VDNLYLPVDNSCTYPHRITTYAINIRVIHKLSTSYQQVIHNKLAPYYHLEHLGIMRFAPHSKTKNKTAARALRALAAPGASTYPGPPPARASVALTSCRPGSQLSKEHPSSKNRAPNVLPLADRPLIVQAGEPTYSPYCTAHIALEAESIFRPESAYRAKNARLTSSPWPIGLVSFTPEDRKHQSYAPNSGHEQQSTYSRRVPVFRARARPGTARACLPQQQQQQDAGDAPHPRPPPPPPGNPHLDTHMDPRASSTETSAATPTSSPRRKSTSTTPEKRLP